MSIPDRTAFLYLFRYLHGHFVYPHEVAALKHYADNGLSTALTDDYSAIVAESVRLPLYKIGYNAVVLP